MKYFSFLALIFFTFSNNCFALNKQPPQKLTIYSSDSFTNDWMQIGNPIKRAFEFNCNCKVEFITFNNSKSALSKITLEGKNSPADLIVGLTQNTIDQAKATNLFDKISISTDHLTLPVKWNDPYFIPYDYGYLAFVYNKTKLKNPPKSFKELIARNDLKIVIQNPLSSSTGAALLTWINLIYNGDSSKVWSFFNKNIITMTNSWRESYNLFSNDEADMALSYSTSPVFHMMSEDNYDIEAAEFSEGHYLQIELIGKLKHSKNPELAEQFINFILSRSCQRLIPIDNFMFPVIDLGSDMPSEYKEIFIPKKIFIASPTELEKTRKLWMHLWLKSLSKD